jgi:signal transduction histidine kinase
LATRLKSTSCQPWVKLLAALLAIAGALLSGHALIHADQFSLAVQAEDYQHSDSLSWDLNRVQSIVYQLTQFLRSEEFVTSGESTREHWEGELQRELQAISQHFQAWIEDAYRTAQPDQAETLINQRDRELERKRAELEPVLAEKRESLIALDLSVYRSSLAQLEEPDTYLYYAPIKGGGTLQNIGDVDDLEGFFSSLPAHSVRQLPDGSQSFVGMTPQRYAALAEQYLRDRDIGASGLYQFLGGAGLFLLGFGYTLYTAGRQAGSSEVLLGVQDRIYLDVGFLLLAAVAYLGISAVGELLWEFEQSQSPTLLVVGAIPIVALALSLLLYGSMLSKRVKRRELLRHTLAFAVLSFGWRLARTGWQNTIMPFVRATPIAVRVTLLMIAHGLAVGFAVNLRHAAGFFLWLLINAAVMYFIMRKVVALQMITAGTGRIRNGDLAYRIPLDRTPELGALAQNVNNIADGLTAAVDREVKAERMKAELITNVSHDLKTPLTSLITYIDLLKNEGLGSDNAPKYLAILDQKIERLKTLTEDLFEAAKAASGTLSLHLEELDVSSLLTQGMAELQDKLEASGLDFRANLPHGRLCVKADGRLLWRVLENLLSNIIKYALPSSRVYIDVLEQSGSVSITLKNISASPLNITPEELLERFKRGDESRHTEGSGLGLSIANSLTELQGGSFQIAIDGDLFKATVTLPSCE